MLGKLFSRSNLKNQGIVRLFWENINFEIDTLQEAFSHYLKIDIVRTTRYTISKEDPKACTYLKHVAIGGSVEEHLFQTPVLARWSSTATASAQREDSWTKLHYRKGLKGNMRAQFTDPREAAEQEPFFVQKTQGCYVYDNNGKKYLDGVSSLFCTNLGGSEPRIIAAATNQLKTLPFYHSIWNSASKPSLDLAHELLEMFTARKMEKVLFSDCGSEANETQVKLVWYYNNALGRPNKKKIISRKHSYHGATIGTSSLTGIPDFHEGFDLPGPFALQTDDPHYWRNHLKGETEEQFATRLANNLEKLILKQGPETIAAFIAEPVHAAGGVIIPPPTYYEKIQAVLKKYDILFLADEIACGFGRLGTMFGCDKYNIKPDLVSLAKGLSSAYMPIGAVLISPEIAEVVQSHGNKIGLFGHGFTFSGHPVASAVALEAVKIYRERKIDQEVQKISPRFLDGMKYLADSPIVGEVRGVGLLLALEFTENKSPNNIFPSEWKVGQIYQEECKKRGLLVGFRGDLVFFAPPLIISKEEVDELLSTAINALEATEKRVKELKLKQRRQPNLNLIFDCVGC